jgi:hypothetical protein
MAKTPKAAKRTPNPAFMKPVTPDEKLALIVGDKPLPRTELTKKLWAYIRKYGLQDAKKRTLINADENSVSRPQPRRSAFQWTPSTGARWNGRTNLCLEESGLSGSSWGRIPARSGGISSRTWRRC